MQDKETRIHKLLQEVTQLNEYQLSHKNDLVKVVNTIVLATKSAPNPQELDKKLNSILEFYRFYDSNWAFEDLIVYQEFKKKILQLAKDNQISL